MHAKASISTRGRRKLLALMPSENSSQAISKEAGQEAKQGHIRPYITRMACVTVIVEGSVVSGHKEAARRPAPFLEEDRRGMVPPIHFDC